MVGLDRSTIAGRGAAACLACVLLATGPTLAAGGDWTAEDASGAVETRPSYEARDHWFRVRSGDRLEPLAAVRTGKRGRATLVREDHRLVVQPESELELPVLDGPEDLPQVLQGRGSVSYDVDADAGGLEVVTPYLVATTASAAFGVEIDDGVARLRVRSGTVTVTSRIDGSSARIRAGESTVVDASDARPIEVRRSNPDPSRRVYRDAEVSRPVSGPALPTR